LRAARRRELTHSPVRFSSIPDRFQLPDAPPLRDGGVIGCDGRWGRRRDAFQGRCSGMKLRCRQRSVNGGAFTLRVGWVRVAAAADRGGAWVCGLKQKAPSGEIAKEVSEGSRGHGWQWGMDGRNTPLSTPDPSVARHLALTQPRQWGMDGRNTPLSTPDPSVARHLALTQPAGGKHPQLETMPKHMLPTAFSGLCKGEGNSIENWNVGEGSPM
jgi:hypothetical protein